MPVLNTVASDLPGIYKQRISSIVNDVCATLHASANNLASAVFSNPEKLTAQQLFNALGTQAGTLVTFLTQSQVFLATLYPNYVPMTLPAYTVNADGTVTVTVVQAQVLESEPVALEHPVSGAV